MDDLDAKHKLTSWFKSSEGYINPILELKSDAVSGQHFRASEELSINDDNPVSLCKCPFSLSLSFLNILHTPPKNAKDCSKSSVCAHLVDKIPKAVQSYFFLCEQRLKGKDSFWEPYISALPKEEEMCTPLWFDEQDLKWLLGTTIYLSLDPEKSGVHMRRAMWMEQWEGGVEVLRDAGVDVDGFTWELFLWAATIFSSRSFTSSILMPTASKPAETESFALLYPVLDLFNHRFGAKVFWNVNHGDFEISTTDPVKAGNEVFNNYAPKGNQELLMGYGFCVPGNPCDEVAIRIGKPPETICTILRSEFPTRFTSPVWDSNAATFFIRGSEHYSKGYPNEEPCLRGIPPDMFGVIRTILALSYKEQGEELPEEHLDGATVEAIYDKLVAKLQAIRSWDGELTEEPRNEKQRFAKIYRDGLLEILEEIIGELQGFLDQF